VVSDTVLHLMTVLVDIFGYSVRVYSTRVNCNRVIVTSHRMTRWIQRHSTASHDCIGRHFWILRKNHTLGSSTRVNCNRVIVPSHRINGGQRHSTCTAPHDRVGRHFWILRQCLKNETIVTGHEAAKRDTRSGRGHGQVASSSAAVICIL
jgi:hypothetical protein